jgi:PKD repeat protein
MKGHLGLLMKRLLLVLVATTVYSGALSAQTVITNTRVQIAEMAGLWEVDSLEVSPFANQQYPSVGSGTNLYQFLFPSGDINSDGDEDIETGINSAGTGKNSGNGGYSPIHTEIINITSAQVSHLGGVNTEQGRPHGIFRFYTEHLGERQFEIHPITEVDTWNASSNAFVFDSDYHGNVVADPNATTHANSTLLDPFNGSETVTAQVMADNTNVIFTYPSPNVNYVQYGGTALSPLLVDSVSPYFYFNPTSAYTDDGQEGISLPGVAVRCRVITNTAAAMNATGLSSNMSLSVVNGLLRTDMIVMSNDIASLSTNQSKTFTYPNELILLGLTGPSPVPYLYVTPSASSFSSSGGKGGPFSPSTNVYNLVNIGSGSVTWSATNMTSWLSISPASGTLAAGSNMNVTVALNANANDLFPATYSDTVTFTNLTNGGGGTTSSVSLTVSGSPFQNIQTVFIILEENQNWASISGSATCPYINNTLLPMASFATQYYNPPGNHPSLPNYLWLEAGTNFGITADGVPGPPDNYSQTTTNHLVTLLKNAGISWTSYQEGMTPDVCPLTTNVTQYAPKHNPMVFFDDVTNTNNANSAYCIANVRPFTELAGDLQSNVVTRYNFITPDLCDDMHGNNGCATGNALVTAGDTWLSENIPIIMASQAYSNNGAIFITWDEGEPETGENGDGPIGMIVISPLVKGGGYSNSIYYTHSSTLLTMQEIFSVGPLLGDAVNATDLSDLFAFGPAALSVTPASGLSSSGQIGGPFSPPSQTYALQNLGGAPLNWIATNSFNWLTLSATNGTLDAAATTNITVSFNANADSLASGIYSDTVSFVNLSNGSGTTTRPVNLTVNNPAAQLAVTPGSGFVSVGPPGGPFNPISQTYTVSNIGGLAMNWTATNSSTWLTLSATSGTLAASASTNVTATINANASSLPGGSYSDTIGFTNATNGAGNTTRAVTLNMFGFYDNFSTFSSGNLVGQSSWTQLGTLSGSAIQIAGGQAGFTGGLTNNNQTAYKNFALTNETVFYGLTLTVTNTPITNTATYFVTMYSGSNATGNASFRLAAGSPNSAKTNYVLGVKITPAANDPFTFGAKGLSYGTQYRVIVEAVGGGGTNVIVYVNPTSGTLGAQTPYTNNVVGTGITTVGSVAIAQLGSSTTPSAGGLIGKFVVADNFGVVYNDLLSTPPPSASFTATPTNGVAPLNVAFTDTSSGSPTSWAWTFGDGGTSTAQNPNYTYTAPGTYTVTLIASNAGGSSTNTQVNLITALVAPPVASFLANPTSGAAPLTVNFTDSSTGSITGWAWAFGDGNTSISQSPADIYVTPGTYTVQEIVSGPGGSGTDTVANLISVYDPFAWWQQAYGITNCALCVGSASYTGDGMSNTNKFMAGFNPTNAGAYLHIISIMKQPAVGNTNNVVVTYLGADGDNTYTPGIASRTNVLDYMTGGAYGNYTNGGWQDTGQTNILGGGNGSGVVTNMTDTAIPGASTDRFYRVRVLLP